MNYHQDDINNVKSMMDKVNITKDNEVLYTGHQKPGIIQLGKDAPNRAVLDSACSSMICGWLVRFYGISTFVGYLMPNPFFM